MNPVPADARRTTETPHATTTTLASPTLGGASSSLWLVEMSPDSAGPIHAFDAEVIWSITAGSGHLEVDGARRPLGPGDTVVLPARAMRRFVAGPDGFSAVVATGGPGEVTRGDGTSAGVPPWVG